MPTKVGFQTCPGGDCDATHSTEMDYAALLPSMFKMNAGYFLTRLPGEPGREQMYRLIGEHGRDDANGVAQVCFIGVINPRDPQVEIAAEVADALTMAARHIPKGRLGSSGDRGFSPFSIDVKPKRGSPDFARVVAFWKIRARVGGTRSAAERLGA